MIHHGDLFDVLPSLEADSIDACVTDPPYGLGFMGKEWDTFKPGVAETRIVANRAIASDNPNLKGRTRGPALSPSAVVYDRSLRGQHEFQAWSEAWAREVYRVLKPGAHMVVCGAPRSGHRMIAGIEDAGFEIRDCLCWLFGQGFPKSLDISKAIDKAAGVAFDSEPASGVGFMRPDGRDGYNVTKNQLKRSGESVDAAKQWDGWGTALKPAMELIVLARKPFKGSVAQNVLKHGTGGINVDACRIGTELVQSCNGSLGRNGIYGSMQRDPDTAGVSVGRWPANVLLDEIAAAQLDEMSGESISRAGEPRSSQQSGNGWGMKATGSEYNDSGGASRFFYVAKPSASERNLGHWDKRQNHPTVKPIELMRWLIRLITPPGGTVLDPFCGSGSTGCAAAFELRPFIGIEREAEYVAIAERRIRECAPLFQDEAGA